MSAAPPRITEAERVVLEPLWRLGLLTPARLITEVRKAEPWAETTIKTLLARLKAKGAVCSERVEGAVRYRPLLDRASYVATEVQALVDRAFGGDRAALAAYLMERGTGRPPGSESSRLSAP